MLLEAHFLDFCWLGTCFGGHTPLAWLRSAGDISLGVFFCPGLNIVYGEKCSCKVVTPTINTSRAGAVSSDNIVRVHVHNDFNRIKCSILGVGWNDLAFYVDRSILHFHIYTLDFARLEESP